MCEILQYNSTEQPFEMEGCMSFCFDQVITDVEEEEFEIGIKQNRKKFNSSLEKKQFIEEYTKKKKTELCKNFMLKGSCKFGSECSYAHGYSELLPKAHLHENYSQDMNITSYKTKPCKNFINNGWCNYGSRCQYIHPENSLKKKKLHIINSNDKYISNSQKGTNQNTSQPQEKQENPQILINNMAYSELLRKLISSPQIRLQNLPRLSFFRRLGKSNACFLSDDSDR